VCTSMEGSAATMGSKLNTALMKDVVPSTIMDEFIAILPWVGAMVPVAFVIREAKKLIKGASKGKVTP